jgi:hypothetical protein
MAPHLRQPIRGRALNLSPSGVFIEAEAACAVGTDLICDIPLPGGRRRLKGRVARTQALPRASIGLGIEFLELEARDQAVLHQLVRETGAHSRLVKVRFEGLREQLRSQAVMTDDGMRLSTALPFLRLTSEVDVSIIAGESRIESKGVVRDVQIEPKAADGVPRLAVDVALPGGVPDAARTPAPAPSPAEAPQAAAAAAPAPALGPRAVPRVEEDSAPRSRPPARRRLKLNRRRVPVDDVSPLPGTTFAAPPAPPEPPALFPGPRLAPGMTPAPTPEPARPQGPKGAASAPAAPGRPRAPGSRLDGARGAPRSATPSSVTPGPLEAGADVPPTEATVAREIAGLRLGGIVVTAALGVLAVVVVIDHLTLRRLGRAVETGTPPAVGSAPVASPPRPRAAMPAAVEPSAATGAPATPAPTSTEPPMPTRLFPPPRRPGEAPPPPAPPLAVLAPKGARAPEVLLEGDRATASVPVRGSTAGMVHYSLAKPRGVAINLPLAESVLPHGVHVVGRGGFTNVWIRERPEGGIQVRFLFDAKGVDERVLDVDGQAVKVQLQRSAAE